MKGLDITNITHTIGYSWFARSLLYLTYLYHIHISWETRLVSFLRFHICPLGSVRRTVPPIRGAVLRDVSLKLRMNSAKKLGYLIHFHQKIPMYLSYMRIIICLPFTNVVKVMKDSEGILNPSKSTACSFDFFGFPEWSVEFSKVSFGLEQWWKAKNEQYCLRCGTTMSSANLGMKILEWNTQWCHDTVLFPN